MFLLVHVIQRASFGVLRLPVTVLELVCYSPFFQSVRWCSRLTCLAAGESPVRFRFPNSGSVLKLVAIFRRHPESCRRMLRRFYEYSTCCSIFCFCSLWASKWASKWVGNWGLIFIRSDRKDCGACSFTMSCARAMCVTRSDWQRLFSASLSRLWRVCIRNHPAIILKQVLRSSLCTPQACRFR